VLVVVVERDAQRWKENLGPLHEELFGAGKADPMAPTHLEVIDRAADDAIQRLIAAGLMARTTRAARPLFPEAPAATTPPPLSAEERDKANAHRAQAARRLKMARLLAQGELIEEARAPLLDAIHSLGRALAVESRLPDPPEPRDVVLAPLSLCWKGALQPLRDYVAQPAAAWQPVADALDKVCNAPS
jgi:hypothetical protein